MRIFFLFKYCTFQCIMFWFANNWWAKKKDRLFFLIQIFKQIHMAIIGCYGQIDELNHTVWSSSAMENEMAQNHSDGKYRKIFLKHTKKLCRWMEFFFLHSFLFTYFCPVVVVVFAVCLCVCVHKKNSSGKNFFPFENTNWKLFIRFIHSFSCNFN